MNMTAISSSEIPDTYRLPDLASHCPFPLRIHPNAEATDKDTTAWITAGCPELSPKEHGALRDMKGGMLAAYCYPDCEDERLQVVSDFLVYFFHIDNTIDTTTGEGVAQLADVVMNAVWLPDKYLPTAGQPEQLVSASVLARDFWTRCIRKAKPGVQERFKENLGLYFEAGQEQALHRNTAVIPDVESYITLRRDTSGCKPAFDLIEYTLDIELPDFVIEHPVIKTLKQCTDDIVTWYNDLYSFNVEQARGDTHNLVAIAMEHQGFTVQQAVDYVGDLLKQTMDKFVDHQGRLPSWGAEIDADVAVFVQGLHDWIAGGLHWNFTTERYFGKEGEEIKKSGIVKLLPKKVKATVAPS